MDGVVDLQRYKKDGKMKILLLVSMLASCASLERVPTKKIQTDFEYDIEFAGMSRKEMYRKSLVFLANHYVNVEAVLTFRDEVEGLIKGRSKTCLLMRGVRDARCFRYNISIECRTGAAKIRFFNLEPMAHAEHGAIIPGIDTSYKIQSDFVKMHFDNMGDRWQRTIKH